MIKTKELSELSKEYGVKFEIDDTSLWIFYTLEFIDEIPLKSITARNKNNIENRIKEVIKYTVVNLQD